MATYEYSCSEHGRFDVTRPIGTAPAAVDCPVCGRSAPRAISLPRVRTSQRVALTAALDHADKSRFEPEVVNRLPPSGAPSRTVALTPQLARLPRP